MGASVWPWLALAAAGALHGLNPLSGWAALACARGAGAAHRPMPLLLAIAAGAHRVAKAVRRRLAGSAPGRAR